MPAAFGLDQTVDDRITHVVVDLANKIGADAIITPSLSGRTARLIARHRPGMPVIAPVPSEAIRRRLAVVWGVEPVLMEDHKHDGDNRMRMALQAAFDAGAIQAGQCAIVLASHPIEAGPRVPTIQFVRVGKDGTAVEI